MCRARPFALALAVVLLSAAFADAGWLFRSRRISCPGGACGGSGPTAYCPCVDQVKCSPQTCPTTRPYPLPSAATQQTAGQWVRECNGGTCSVRWVPSR